MIGYIIHKYSVIYFNMKKINKEKQYKYSPKLNNVHKYKPNMSVHPHFNTSVKFF